MKKIIGILLILLVSAVIIRCERDDICAENTPTTPRLIIKFFDSDNPTEPKAPNNLAITAMGQSNSTGPFLTTSSDSIAIPLRTGIEVMQTVFTFVQNSNMVDEGEANEDVLTLRYIQEEDFVSKACGFRVVYKDLLQQSEPGPDGAWIQTIELQTFTIEDELQAHIHIFH